MHRSKGTTTLLPEVLLLGYRNGFFPMAEAHSGNVQWHRPDPRAIIPLDGVRISRSLRKVIASGTFRVTENVDFPFVIHACSRRADTWITPEIIDAYIMLHHLGFAHSIEVWLDDAMVGGLYGVSVAGAFFGESMFSTRSNASKVAFAHLVARMRERGLTLLDTQYINDFTESLGAIEIPDRVYQQLLHEALLRDVTFG
ncbi:MAG: leucyl/phenylalanyl-tRNA--protein transferase [Bradyrhizobiaceae bacterium]|nr:leucyl/phenylalanyl-tRNA--protein transferase [Bradyrhizobiaceae bacterium]